MTLQPTVHEYQRLHEREVAREYQKRGYEVLINPTPAQLPEFLAPFQIDLLARNAEENVVIEVRTYGSITDAPELDAIARALQDKPSWRFELVVSNPRDRASVYFKDAITLSTSDIASRLDEARHLSDEEHGEAALLLAWSATEALLRHIAGIEAIQVTGHEPSQVTKSLYTYGVLDIEQYHSLQDALDTRNMLVHGYKERHSLIEVVERLLYVAEQLQSRYQYS